MSILITSVHARFVLRNENGNALTDYLATALVILAGLIALVSVFHGGVFNDPFKTMVTAVLGKATTLIGNSN